MDDESLDLLAGFTLMTVYNEQGSGRSLRILTSLATLREMMDSGGLCN